MAVILGDVGTTFPSKAGEEEPLDDDPVVDPENFDRGRILLAMIQPEPAASTQGAWSKLDIIGACSCIEPT